MRPNGWISIVKWFAILWTIGAIAVLLISNVMVIKNVASPIGVLPIDVRNNLGVALLLAPGAIAAIALLMLQRKKRTAALPKND